MKIPPGTKAAVMGNNALNVAFAAAMLRRAGISTAQICKGRTKRNLAAAADTDVAVICDGNKFIVRDMVMRQQRDATRDNLRRALTDAFDGFLLYPENNQARHKCVSTKEAEALCAALVKEAA